jgi:hypothetical protein
MRPDAQPVHPSVVNHKHIRPTTSHLDSFDLVGVAATKTGMHYEMRTNGTSNTIVLRWLRSDRLF